MFLMESVRFYVSKGTAIRRGGHRPSVYRRLAIINPSWGGRAMRAPTTFTLPLLIKKTTDIIDQILTLPPPP